MTKEHSMRVQDSGKVISLSDFFKAFAQDDDSIHIRTFDDKKKNMSLAKKIQFPLADVSMHIPELEEMNAAGAGIYFAVNGQDTDREVLEHGMATAQFWECDDKSLEEQRQIFEDAPLSPSIVIKTAKSFHVYYLLKDGKAARFRGLQGTLCDYAAGDSSVKNESRVMRVPSFYHQKGEPIMVELIKFEPELRYNQDDIQEAFAPFVSKAKSEKQTKARKNITDSPELVTAATAEKITEGNRHNFLYSTGCKLIEAGLTKEAVFNALIQENRARCAVPLEESEVSYILDCAYKYKDTPDQRMEWRQNNIDWRADFHKWSKPDKNGKFHPTDTYDDRIVEDIISKNNLFRLFGKFYIQDKDIPSFYRMDDDEAMLRSMIADYIHEDIRTSTRINRIYNLFAAKPQLRVEECDINRCPRSWIVFRNKILDVKTMRLHEHDPKFRCINVIPYDYDPGFVVPDDSIAKHFLESLIPDEDDRQMFLEFCGYSMTLDMSQQKLLMIRGQGGIGKSVLLRMHKRAVGDRNCSGLTLQNLNDRFSPAFLFGKLVNIYADTPSTDMDEINGIKTITGEDTIRAEYKGGDLFFFNPYCKLMYSTNRVPKSRDDKTNAYYRRLLILPIEKRAEHIISLEDKLSADIESYIHLCVEAVHQMYQRGYILESAASQREVLELYMATDSVMAFLHDRTERDNRSRVERQTLYSEYVSYCTEEGRERYLLSRNGFYQNLRDKGYGEVEGKPGRYFTGIRIIPRGFEHISTEDIPF